MANIQESPSYQITEGTTAYCLKCCVKVTIENAVEETRTGSNGIARRLVRGDCPQCRTPITKILPSGDATPQA